MFNNYRVYFLLLCFIGGPLAAMEPKKLALTGYAQNFLGDDGDSALTAERSRARLALEIGAGVLGVGTIGFSLWHLVQSVRKKQFERKFYEKWRPESVEWLNQKKAQMGNFSVEERARILIGSDHQTHTDQDVAEAVVNLFDHVQRAYTDPSQYVEKEKLHELFTYATGHMQEKITDDAVSKRMVQIHNQVKDLNKLVFGPGRSCLKKRQDLVTDLFSGMKDCRNRRVALDWADCFVCFSDFYFYDKGQFIPSAPD